MTSTPNFSPLSGVIRGNQMSGIYQSYSDKNVAINVRITPGGNKISQSIKYKKSFTPFKNAKMGMAKAGKRIPGLFHIDSKKAFKDMRNSWDKVKNLSMNVENVRIYGVAVDRVTPKIIEMQIWLDQIGTIRANAIQKAISVKIKKKYRNENDGTWAKNKESWKKAKQRGGWDTRPMHMHDSNLLQVYHRDYTGTGGLDRPPLVQAVDNIDKYIKVSGARNVAVVTGIDEAFQQHEFVWLHETGTKVFPARPFIVPGISEAVEASNKWITVRSPLSKASPVSKAKDKMTYTIGVPPKTGGRIAGGGAGSFQSTYSSSFAKVMSRMGRYIWWFMPPSNYWMYLGIASELEGILKGQLLSATSIQAFLSAYIRGIASGVTGVPLSEKFARRRFRYAIYPRGS